MFDSTKNDKPCCLMNPDDLKALQECGGPWEFLRVDGEWEEIDHPNWHRNYTYRQKPQPKLWWVSSDTFGNGCLRAVVRQGDETLSAEEMKEQGFRLMREVE